jgi:hypothetical protein
MPCTGDWDLKLQVLSFKFALFRKRNFSVWMRKFYKSTRNACTTAESISGICQSQRQNYFMTGGLPPISSSWLQASWDPRTVFFFSTEHLWLWSLCNILFDDRMGLSFTIAAGPRQRSHSQVWVPWDSQPYFTVSDSWLPQPGGPGPHIYIPRNRVVQLYPQALGSLIVASYD